MGKTKKTNYRKKAYKKKTYPLAIYKKPKTLAPNTWYYKQSYQLPDISSQTATNQLNGYYFTLAALPQAATFTALYDEYCITKITIKFIPNRTIGSNADPSSWSVPPFYSVIDYDDAAPPANLDEMMQYQTFKSTTGGYTHVRSFTPKIATLAYKTSGTTIGYSAKSLQYVDCGSADIEHYGLKTLLPPTGGITTGIVTYKPIVTVYVRFKGVR